MRVLSITHSFFGLLIGVTTLALIKVQVIAILDGTEVNKIAKQATVLVNGQNSGSGVLFDKQEDTDTYYVLTAKHVVEREDEYKVVTSDENVHPLDYNQIKMLPEVDLAIAQFTSPHDYEPADLGDSNTLTEGDTIFIAGWPESGAAIPHIYQFTTGQISGLPSRPLPGGYGLIYTNVTRAGMSGGPVFNNNGKVVGIHGQAEGREVYLPNYESDVILAGFNLGIPVNRFLSEVRKLPLTLENLPTPPAVQNPSRPVYFDQPLRLINVSAPNRTQHRESSYYFTINLPTDAAQPLEQVTFTQIEGHDYPRFSMRETHAFEGTRNNRGAPLPLSLVANDTSAKTLTVTFNPPVSPGQEFTIALRARNPDEGTYLYRLTAFPPGESSRGFRIGTGRLQFYERVRW